MSDQLPTIVFVLLCAAVTNGAIWYAGEARKRLRRAKNLLDESFALTRYAASPMREYVQDELLKLEAIAARLGGVG